MHEFATHRFFSTQAWSTWPIYVIWNTHTNEVKRFGSAPIIGCITTRISIGGYHQLIIFAYNKVPFMVVGGGGGGQPLNLNLGGTIDLGDVRRGIRDGSQPLLFSIHNTNVLFIHSFNTHIICNRTYCYYMNVYSWS